jgi:hypothetical protein
MIGTIPAGTMETARADRLPRGSWKTLKKNRNLPIRLPYGEVYDRTQMTKGVSHGSSVDREIQRCSLS